jgi:hypothetical protein
MIRGVADALSRVVHAADNSLELVDRARDELAGSTRGEATRPASIGRRGVADRRQRRPLGGEARDQAARGLRQAWIFGHGDRFDQGAEPFGALEGRRLVERPVERGCSA